MRKMRGIAMRTKHLQSALLLALLLAILSFAGLTQAQDPLLAQARQNGSVRVIVGLKANADVGRVSPGANAAAAPTQAQAQVQAQAQLAAFQQQRQALVASLGANATVYANSNNWHIPFIALKVNEAGLKALRASSLVKSVVEDGRFELFLQQSTAVIHADEAWDYGYEGSGWAVAVLDTGVLTSHPMFTNKPGGSVIEEACFSYDDPFWGIHELCATASSSPGSVVTAFGAGSSSPSACQTFGPDYGPCDHGTHVAGIAAGQNDTGVRGVAPRANIIGINVFSGVDNCDGYGSSCTSAYWSALAAAMDYVYSLSWSYNIAAVNMSLGGGFANNQAVCDDNMAFMKAAVDNLRSVGVATVIASGNNGFTNGISYPACISSAFAVGASDKFDVPAGFSNSHALLDLYAPGVSIYSAILGNGYSSWDGTSMATPHVAGAWAVLKQAYANTWGYNPSVDAIYRAFRDTGYNIAKNGVSRPRIDVGRAARLLNGFMTLSAKNAAPLPNKVFDRIASLGWTPVDWALRYEIQVDNNSNFSSPEFSTTVEGYQNWVDTGALSDGIYYWRVRAMKTDYPKITYGPWSTVASFTVDYYLEQYP